MKTSNKLLLGFLILSFLLTVTFIVGARMSMTQMKSVDELALSEDGNIKILEEERTLDVTEFSGIRVEGPFHIRLVKSNATLFSIKASEVMMPHIKSEVSRNTLTLSIDTEGNWATMASIEIPYQEISELSMSRSGRIDSSEPLVQEELTVSMSGGAHFTAPLEVEELSINMHGSSRAMLNGKAARLEAALHGGSRLEAEHLEVQKAKVDCFGSARAKVWPMERLNAEAHGGSVISYRGTSAEITKSSFGSSSVRKLEDSDIKPLEP